ncbi:MAG: hydrogenase iron-sulfur subunit [Candidatus Latescibacterota bacterium]
MPQRLSPDVVVYVCANCVPSGPGLPRQWTQGDARVAVRQVPCTGKTDGQYLLHGLEGGGQGFCVVACPHGECRLGQGNYRAEIRVRTLQRLLAEIGLEPERAQLLHCAPGEGVAQIEQRVRGAVERICALGPLGAAPAPDHRGTELHPSPAAGVATGRTAG